MKSLGRKEEQPIWQIRSGLYYYSIIITIIIIIIIVIEPNKATSCIAEKSNDFFNLISFCTHVKLDYVRWNTKKILPSIV